MKMKGAIIDKGAVGSISAPPPTPSVVPGQPPVQAPGEVTTIAMAKDIRGDAERVYSAHFPLQPSRDVNFELARVLMGLQDYGSAVGLFTASIQAAGNHHVTQFNRGLCYHASGDLASALLCFNEALELFPGYAEAASWRDKVQGRLAGVPVGSTPMPVQSAGQSEAAAGVLEDIDEDEAASPERPLRV
jgi:tetratricopeptide (TPR) repeat protein